MTAGSASTTAEGTHPAQNALPFEIPPGLKQGEDGIWYAASRETISYPQEGNLNCLALEADSFWFAHRNRCIQAVLRRFPPGGTVVDVGGGNGYVALGLQQSGLPVALVEPGEQGARNARQRGVATVICATLQEAGFRAASLPAVGLFDVLEHIQADESFLREVHTLLAPAGRVYLTVPAYPALWSADDDYAGHYRRYTLSTLNQTLQAAGFRLLFASYFFLLLPLPIWLFRALPTRLGWRKQNAWDRYQQEHSRQSGVTGKLLDWLLQAEVSRLRRGQALPLGGSCLVVAQKS